MTSFPHGFAIAATGLGALPLIWAWTRTRPRKALTFAKITGDSTAAEPAPAALVTPLGARIRPPTPSSGGSSGIFTDVERGLRELPPFPPATAEIMRELDDVMSDAQSVAAAIGREPMLAATLLRVANSALFGVQRQIVTVSDAVAYLGLSTTKALFLRLKIGSLFPHVAPENGYEGRSLWSHAVAVSQASDELARRVGGVEPNLAATLGLLHDIGKLAINSRFPVKVRELWSEELAEQSFLAREAKLFGADHAVIGSRLARQWSLPEQLCRMIRLHHLPPDEPMDLPKEARRATYLVFIANQLAKYCQVYCKQMEIDVIPPEVASELGLAPEPEKLLDERMRRKIQQAISLSDQLAAAA